MIISLWAILATIICIWLITSGRNYFNIPVIALLCVLTYMFLPLILCIGIIIGLIYLIFFR
jgi:hypothetical protein